MSKFSETVQDNTPRLVVMFRRDADNELFQWGVVGAMPLVTLIGYITRVQSELAFRSPEECDESAMVIAWDKDERSFSWFVHPDVPVDSLVGMLETIKATLVGTHLAKQVAAQQMILGPDGRPARR